MTGAESPVKLLHRAADRLKSGEYDHADPAVSDAFGNWLSREAERSDGGDGGIDCVHALPLAVARAVIGYEAPPEPEPVPDFTRRPGDVRATVAANLTRLRREHGWTLEFVAGKARVASNTVCSLERGTAGGGLFTLLAIASVYGITLDELVTPPGVPGA